VNTWDAKTKPDQRYVCAACGKTTEPGGARTDLRDTSCVMHAVLCEAEKRDDGKWWAVEDETTMTWCGA
jgi:hypothetical protein